MPPSLLMETQDPEDPSTILILRVDGCFHLACPLFASNPARYESCPQKHSIRSIRDLIHHLKKHHPHPIYCSVCGQLFGDELTRDRHIRALSCVCRKFDVERGVTRSQLSKIMEKDDRNRREEERWQHIYMLVFPEAEEPPPGAVYIQDGAALAASMARDYWDLRGRRLADEYVQAGILGGNQKSSDQEATALFKFARRELVQRVTEHSRKNECGLLGGATELEQGGWEAVKLEQD